MRQNQLRKVNREAKSVNVGGYAYSISEMFEQFMLIKKGDVDAPKADSNWC
ncbi:hypothetical protein L1999_09385 [Neobacillus drentensis]|uniref:hypothetical protein n=1 Tax=Neobacillus drentensis TaxID=220684 RepID=UPI001F41C843|nr:hypothetical protein [Neobacillus drentensis]ULT58717.1 hypothetical protein L1999_09385 [Neobacillus drentensis]